MGWGSRLNKKAGPPFYRPTLPVRNQKNKDKTYGAIVMVPSVASVDIWKLFKNDMPSSAGPGWVPKATDTLSLESCPSTVIFETVQQVVCMVAPPATVAPQA